MRSATDFGGGKRGRFAKVCRGNMDIIWICSTGILQEKGWGIYHMDVYEVTFNLYFMLKKLLLHEVAENPIQTISLFESREW